MMPRGLRGAADRSHPAAAVDLRRTHIMKPSTLSRAIGAALLGLALAGPAKADPKDYEFQLVQKDMKVGEAVVAVRLVDKRSGKPVPDAVIFAKRIDMAPDGMAMMDSPIEQAPSTEPGIYQFKT